MKKYKNGIKCKNNKNSRKVKNKYKKSPIGGYQSAYVHRYSPIEFFVKIVFIIRF